MSDMSKWPPSKDGKFTQAWVKLSQLPGGMMQSYSVERGHFTYGPIPAFTSCAITTNPDEVEVWRERGEPVLVIFTADGVGASGEVQPLDMVLHCPKCHTQHVDEPDERTPGWVNPPHRSHLCHACGCIWRPADVPTNGVREIRTRGKADTWPDGVTVPRGGEQT